MYFYQKFKIFKENSYENKLYYFFIKTILRNSLNNRLSFILKILHKNKILFEKFLFKNKKIKNKRCFLELCLIILYPINIVHCFLFIYFFLLYFFYFQL